MMQWLTLQWNDTWWPWRDQRWLLFIWSPPQYSAFDPSIHLLHHKNNIQVLRNDVELVGTHKLTPFSVYDAPKLSSNKLTTSCTPTYVPLSEGRLHNNVSWSPLFLTDNYWPILLFWIHLPTRTEIPPPTFEFHLRSKQSETLWLVTSGEPG